VIVVRTAPLTVAATAALTSATAVRTEPPVTAERMVAQTVAPMAAPVIAVPTPVVTARLVTAEPTGRLEADR
jgi:hypothetical protein